MKKQLTEKQKSYIQKHASKLSEEEIAHHINTKTDLVSQFLLGEGFSSSKTKKYIFTSVLFVIPVLIIIILEIMLRMVNYGENIDLIIQKEVFGKTYNMLNPNATSRYFSRYNLQMPTLQEDHFEIQKPSNAYRIFCLGGSTTAGFPYAINASFPDLLEDRLSTVYPSKNIEVVNFGVAAINSYSVYDFAKELKKYEPDLFLVYMGHNEFYGAFGAGSYIQIPGNRSLIKLYLDLQKFKSFLWLKDAIYSAVQLLKDEKQAKSKRTLMQAMVKNQVIPLNSKKYNQAKSVFRENLTEIIEQAKESGASVLISNLVSSENGMAPFESEFCPKIREENKKEWLGYFSNGQNSRKLGRFEEALEYYKQAEEIDSCPAQLHYQIGVCLESLQQYNEARDSYRLAKDHDALRFRASSEFNHIIQEVCEESGVAFVDLERKFRENSANGIIGEKLITEHLHPNFDGYLLMAKTFATAINEHGFISPQDAYQPDLAKSDEKYREMASLTTLDETLAKLRIAKLTNGWPFNEMSAFNNDINFPDHFVEDVATELYQKKINWREARFKLAKYYSDNKKYDKAEDEYRAVLKMVPWDYPANIKIGDIHLRKEDFEEAERWYKAAWLINKKSAGIYAKLGVCSLMRNNFQQSRDFFEKSLQLFEEGSQLDMKSQLEARYFLSVCYLRLGNTFAAQDGIQAILRVQPEHSKALNLLKKITAIN